MMMKSIVRPTNCELLKLAQTRRIERLATARLHFSSSSRREPPMAPLTNPVEQAIEEARRRGKLSNLSGSGKPMQKKTKDGDVHNGVMSGRMSPSQLISTKAEFEMRRAIRNRELENLGGEGEKLKYKGTTGISPSLTGGGTSTEGGGGGSDAGTNAMGKYILKQTLPSNKTK